MDCLFAHESAIDLCPIFEPPKHNDTKAHANDIAATAAMQQVASLYATCTCLFPGTKENSCRLEIGQEENILP